MPTLLEIMVSGAQLARKVTTGTVDAGSTQHHLVDAALRDTAVDEGAFAGVWVYIPTMSNGDAMRQLTERPFGRELASLEPTRPWSVAPATDAVYYLFETFPPMPHPAFPNSWRDAANRGLANMWYEDHVQLTVVGGQPAQFIVPAQSGWVPQRDDLAAVYARAPGPPWYEQDVSKNGYWRDITVTGGVITVTLPGPPATGVTIWADVIRPVAPLTLYSDTAAVSLEAAGYATFWQYLVLSNATPTEQADAWRRFNNRYARPPVRITL